MKRVVALKQSGRSTNTVGSVDKALAVLEALSEHGEMSLRSLASVLRLHESTVHHVLANLKRKGYVEQDEERGEYRLGLRVVDLTNRYLARMDLYGAGADHVRRLRDRSGETSYLTVRRDLTLVSLIELPGTRPVQARRPYREGEYSLHSTASGKTLLANEPTERREAALASLPLTRFTPQTIIDGRDLLAEFATIRRQGYGLDREENIDGVMCVAAPIFDRHGDCVATTSVAFLRAGPERVAELIPLVVQTARAISARLGFVSARLADGVA